MQNFKNVALEVIFYHVKISHYKKIAPLGFEQEKESDQQGCIVLWSTSGCDECYCSCGLFSYLENLSPVMLSFWLCQITYSSFLI